MVPAASTSSYVAAGIPGSAASTSRSSASAKRVRKSTSSVPSVTRVYFESAQASSSARRDPDNTATVSSPDSRASVMAVTAARMAAAQSVSTRLSPSRTCGDRRRVAAVRWAYPKRPLSQFHISLTAGFVRAIWRWTSPRRACTVVVQPAEHISHTDEPVTTSNGRALNR